MTIKKRIFCVNQAICDMNGTLYFMYFKRLIKKEREREREGEKERVRDR